MRCSWANFPSSALPSCFLGAASWLLLPDKLGVDDLAAERRDRGMNRMSRHDQMASPRRLEGWRLRLPLLLLLPLPWWWWRSSASRWGPLLAVVDVVVSRRRRHRRLRGRRRRH